MRQQDDMKMIIDLLSRWISLIKLNTALELYDVNKHSEDTILSILNQIYGYELVNLNDESKSFPGIDLGDEKKGGVAFQVTSRTDAKKIKDSLEQFVKNEYFNKYPNGIRFVVLSDEKVKLGNIDFSRIYSGFDPNEHIINMQKLLLEIKKLYRTDFSKFNKIKTILVKELDQYQTIEEERTKKNFLIKISPYIALLIFIVGLVTAFSNYQYVKDLLVSNLMELISFLVFILLTYILLKVSDNKFKELEKEHYPKSERHPSREKVPIETIIYKDNLIIQQKIDIKNHTNRFIKKVNGKVIFYNNDIKVYEKRFCEVDIFPNKGATIDDNNFMSNWNAYYWDSYLTYIEKIETDKDIVENIDLFGVKIFKTFFLILNKYKYMKFWKLRIPFEVSFLIEEWYFTVLPWLIRSPSFPINSNQPFKSFVIRLSKVIIRLVLIIALIFFLLKAIEGLLVLLEVLISLFMIM